VVFEIHLIQYNLKTYKPIILDSLKKMNPKPPIIPRILLCLFRDTIEHESLFGDYDEMFRFQYENDSPMSARTWYWFQVLKALPSFIVYSFYWRYTMIKNYIKITVSTQ